MGHLLLTDDDFVSVTDAAGNRLPPVPKHWGAEQLPAGATKKKRLDKQDQTPEDDVEEPDEVEEPSKSASRANWVDFAREAGAPEEELVEPKEGGLSRDELAAKYGTLG